MEQTFAALSDKTRFAVVELLRKQPRRAGELAETLSLDPAALSRHLRVLRKAGLIVDSHPEHDARVRLYRLRPEGFASLRSWLDEVEAFWAAQLDAFAAHFERNEGNDQ